MRFLQRLIDRVGAKAPEHPPRVEHQVDLTAPSFYADPYPVWQRLREHDPAHVLPNGALLLTRHADIATALADARLVNRPSRFSAIGSRHRERRASADVAANILPFLDGSKHRERRRHLASAIRTVVGAIEPEIATLAREHAGGFAAAGGGDILSGFATPYSFAVASRLFGIGPGHTADLSRWSDAFFRLFAPATSREALDQTDMALAEFRAFFLNALASGTAEGSETILRSLNALIASGSLSEVEAADAAMLIYADSVENVDALVANALAAVEADPTWKARMMTEPGAPGAIVEETLRYDPPGQVIARIAAVDCEIAGRAVRAEMPVFLALGSGNRDASAWPEPDRFDPGRRQAPVHLAFGAGKHGCLGARLVRLTATAALAALVEECRTIAVRTEGLEWAPRFGHRWLKGLTVMVEPR